MSEVVVYVNSATGLSAALKAATGGERIVLESGDYGDFSIYRNNFAQPVTIISADGAGGASFYNLRVYESSNIRFDSLTVDRPLKDGEKPGSVIGMRVQDCQDIAISGCNFHGSPDGDLTNDGIGLRVTSSSNVAIYGNNFHDLYRGVTFLDVENLTVSENIVTDMRCDGFDFESVRHALIENNYMTHFPIQYGVWEVDGDHKDFMQFQDPNIANLPQTSDVVIRGNVLIQEGTMTQGIFFRCESGRYYEDITIENNIIYTSSSHGIRLNKVDGAVVQNNTVIATSTAGNTVAGITVDGGSLDVAVTGNLATRVTVTADSQATATDNLLVQATNPSQPDYVTNYLENPLDPHSAADFAPIQGSGAEDVGAVARIAELRSSDLYILVDSKDGTIDSQTPVFSVGHFDDALGDPAGSARYVWRFEDGVELEGETVSRRFATAGQHKVTLIADHDGITETLTRTVMVENPLLLDLEFDGETKDLSDRKDVFGNGTAVTWTGTAGYTAGTRHGAANFDGASTVVVAKGDQFSGLDKMTLTFDFRSNLTTEARLVRLVECFSVNLNSGILRIELTGSDDQTRIYKLNAAQTNDHGWHNFTMTFDGDAGAATVYLDGNQIGLLTGLTPSLNATSNRQLTIGSSWGGYLNGAIDNLRIYNAVVPPQSEKAALDTVFDTAKEIDLDFNALGVDAETSLDVKAVGHVDMGQGEWGDAAHFDGTGYLDLGRDQRMFGMEDLDFSLRFNAELNNGEHQRILWNHWCYGVGIRGDDMNIQLFDKSGAVTRIDVNDVLTYNRWTDLSVSYDKSAGTVDVFLDKLKVAHRDDVHIEFAEARSWDVTVGSDSWGKDFHGMVSNLVIGQNQHALLSSI